MGLIQLTTGMTEQENRATQNSNNNYLNTNAQYAQTAGAAASGSALAQQIAAKAPVNSPNFTGTVGLTTSSTIGALFTQTAFGPSQVTTNWANIGPQITLGGLALVVGFDVNSGLQFWFLIRYSIGICVVIASMDNTSCSVQFHNDGSYLEIKTGSGTVQFDALFWTV